MEDQTTSITKQDTANPNIPSIEDNGTTSHILQVSIRGWIVLMITLTFCSSCLMGIALDDTMKITVTSVISFYFGQNQNQKQNK